MFFFDAYLFADKLGVMETLRAEEFAPVKNSDKNGKNSTPTLARTQMSNLFKKWLYQGHIYEFKDSKEEEILELNFSKTYNGENLNKLRNKIKEVSK